MASTQLSFTENKKPKRLSVSNVIFKTRQLIGKHTQKSNTHRRKGEGWLQHAQHLKQTGNASELSLSHVTFKNHQFMHTTKSFQSPPLALVTPLTMWTRAEGGCKSRTADRLVFPQRSSSHCSATCKYWIIPPLHDCFLPSQFYFYHREKHVSPRPSKGGFSCIDNLFYFFPSRLLRMRNDSRM